MDLDALEQAAAALAEAGPPPGGDGDPWLRRAIAECQARLPPRPALALQARLDSGGAERDELLAARLGMRRNTFLQNVTRARRLIAECLRRRGVDLAAELA
jgi:RNA polymerase sigma-70 factor (ECF subfamily)